jgi:hypothetical protein
MKTLMTEFQNAVYGTRMRIELRFYAQNHRAALEGTRRTGSLRAARRERSLGYRREGRCLVLDTLEAEVVRTIFERADRSQTGSRIAAALNERGRTRRNGRPWTQRQVAAILGRGYAYRDGGLRYGDVTGRNKNFVLLRTEGTA